MAEAIAKIKDAKGVVNCNTGDTDGLLVNVLLEALTGTNRLNVGSYGRSTRTPTNYSSAGQSIDQHLAGIDTALGAGPASHALGGSSHSSDSLSNLNGKVSDATLVHTAYSLAGDVTGSPAATVVSQIKGYSIEGGAPLTKEVMQYSGTQWVYKKGVQAYYDSGWFSVAYNQTYSKAHGLGGHPSHVEVYWAVTNSSPSTIYRVPAYTSSGESAGRGCMVELNSTNVIVRTGTGSGAGTFDTYGFAGTRVVSAGGYYKVLAWGPTHV